MQPIGHTLVAVLPFHWLVSKSWRLHGPVRTPVTLSSFVVRVDLLLICHTVHFMLLLLLSLDAHSHVDDYSGTLGGVRKVHISVLVTSP